MIQDVLKMQNKHLFFDFKGMLQMFNIFYIYKNIKEINCKIIKCLKISI